MSRVKSILDAGAFQFHATKTTRPRRPTGRSTKREDPGSWPLPGSRRTAPHAVSASLAGTTKTNEAGSAAQGIGVRAAGPVLSSRSPSAADPSPGQTFGCVAAPAARLPRRRSAGRPRRRGPVPRRQCRRRDRRTRLGLSPATTRNLDSDSRGLRVPANFTRRRRCRGSGAPSGGGRNGSGSTCASRSTRRRPWHR